VTQRAVRTAMFVVGILLVISGLALIPGGGTLPGGGSAAGGGFTLVLMGGFLLVVAVLERSRYRSESADRSNDPVGPGGGETGGPVDPRFRPTNERFVDPTTRVAMRVLVDPRTGERRYVAEGDPSRTETLA
jgi:hypothetical protein